MGIWLKPYIMRNITSYGLRELGSRDRPRKMKIRDTTAVDVSNLGVLWPLVAPVAIPALNRAAGTLSINSAGAGSDANGGNII